MKEEQKKQNFGILKSLGVFETGIDRLSNKVDRRIDCFARPGTPFYLSSIVLIQPVQDSIFEPCSFQRNWNQISVRQMDRRL